MTSKRETDPRARSEADTVKMFIQIQSGAQGTRRRGRARPWVLL